MYSESTPRRRLIRSVRPTTESIAPTASPIMTTHVPLQFLVGITRLISIYFGLRSLDSVGGAVMTLGLQASVSPEVANQFPSVWAIYIPTLLVYLTLVIATWFLAPFVCRLALRSGSTEPLDVASAHDLNWGEIMIFLTGILLAGWGISRLGDGVMPILQFRSRNLHHELNLADQLNFFIAFALTGLGGLLAVRFAIVYRWCQRRKAADHPSS